VEGLADLLTDSLLALALADQAQDLSLDLWGQ
jgi:hypothetical protein